MRWWARITRSDDWESDPADDYGRWVPTGCTDRAEAAEYLQQVYQSPVVLEWLAL